MLISLDHIDWSKPIVWMNAGVAEDDNGMKRWPCRLISSNIKTPLVLGFNHAILLTYEDETEAIYHVNSFGFFQKDAGSGRSQRTVWNYEGKLPEVKDVENLGKF